MVPRDASIAVYMMTNQPYGALYIGVSSQFEARLIQHREGLRNGFTKSYGLTRLVWYETHEVHDGRDPAGTDDERVAAPVEDQPAGAGQSALG